MVNIAVFASGSGTNFETILSHIEDGSLHVNCACLIADKEMRMLEFVRIIME